MTILVELTNTRTGQRRTIYDEAEASFPPRYSDVLEPAFYFGVVTMQVYRARPDIKRQMFFDVYAAQHGGTWREVRCGVWLHIERK